MAAPIKISVRVKPNAKRSHIEAGPEGVWQIWVKGPPIEGRANAQVIALVAKQFGVPKSKVAIVGGHKSRNKVVEVSE